MWQVTMEDQKWWAGAHPGKTATTLLAMVVSMGWALSMDNPAKGVFEQWQYHVSIGINVLIYLVAMQVLVRDKAKERTKPRPKYGPRLIAMVLLGTLIAQEAHAFDPRLTRPPEPANRPQQQGASLGVGIIVLIGGGYATFWLARKCQKWFGPGGTNKMDGRFDKEYGMIEDSISSGGTCARLSDVSLDPEETLIGVELSLNADGTVSVTRNETVPRGTLVSGPEFQRQLSERTGIEGLGGQRGDPHFSGPQGPIGYFESPIYRDWDGSIVIMDPEQWYYPGDVVTVERSERAQGPWETVFAARLPRENRIRFYDSSEGGRQFYRIRAEVQ